MLSQPTFARFLMREHDQAAHLIKSLRSRRQKEYLKPEREVSRLGRNRAGELAAHNPYARELWMRDLGGQLCRCVGAKAPDWEPHKPVFFVTLIDKCQIIRPVDPDGFHRPSPRFRQIRHAYREAMGGFDYIGMLDPALYVSTQWVEGVPRFVLWHLHALVWNTTRAELDDWAASARWSMHAYLPGATGVDVKEVRPGDLHQMVWYTAKTPRKQYQVWTREKGSLKQYKGKMNGVNAVRLYSEMHRLTLPRLTLAGGTGRKLLHNTISASSTW